KFTYLEVIKPVVASSQVEKPKSPPAAAQINSTAELSKAIEEIVRDVSDDDGWVFLGELGNILSKRHPSFDTRNYGYRKLTPLLESLKGFEIRSDQTSDPNVKHKFIRIKGGSGAY
ncbi:MAG: OST-HTH/LOTUS domain-containing protein, partial [Bacillota bacterium]|nr:OST-HTH/LOTUS domain-containing protein [Bacillota bacterium]